MNISKVYSAQLSGLITHIINIEIDISNGLHNFSIIGLGDKAIEESKDRISSAIKNSGYISPKQKNQKLTISLAPADIRKEGPAFDLGMALAYLLAVDEIKFDSNNKIFLGELSLNGDIRRISGALPLVNGAYKNGFNEIFIPRENIKEAELINNIKIYPVESLNQIINHLNGKEKILEHKRVDSYNTNYSFFNNNDFNLIKGNETAKRALEIAAAGGHNIALYGPPGTGKTMLAKAFQSILPKLDNEEILEVTSIHSIYRKLENPILYPPFRSPHHTSSYASILGGGTIPRPGEISLAHRGVLFMDEFPEFDRKVIESLRQPLEEYSITISRAKGTDTFPSKFILIASMNPCPCGLGNKECKCNDTDIRNYNKCISGPIIDRIDMWIPVYKIDYAKLSISNNINTVESSNTIRNRVEMARKIQKNRFDQFNINKRVNSEMNVSDIDKIVKLNDEIIELLKDSSIKLSLSIRAYHRIIKLAQTIADLDNSKYINKKHILEALQYRKRIS